MGGHEFHLVQRTPKDSGTADSRRHGPSGSRIRIPESRSWMLHRALFPGLPRKRPVDNPGSGFGYSGSGFRRGHVCGNQLYCKKHPPSYCKSHSQDSLRPIPHRKVGIRKCAEFARGVCIKAKRFFTTFLVPGNFLDTFVTNFENLNRTDRKNLNRTDRSNRSMSPNRPLYL